MGSYRFRSYIEPFQRWPEGNQNVDQNVNMFYRTQSRLNLGPEVSWMQPKKVLRVSNMI